MFKQFLFTFLLILPFQCSPLLAETTKFSVGLSYMYANINDKDFDFVEKYELVKNPKDQLQSFNISSSVFYDNGINIAFSTNRLFNKSIKRSVKRKSDGLIFKNETKTTIDSINLAYKVKRFNPGIVLANVGMSKHLFYNDRVVGYEKKNAIVGGFNLGYFATKHLLPSVTYILPNKELDLEGAVSFNINYLF